MSIKKSTVKTLKLGIFVVVLLITIQCTTKSAPAPELPNNISGIKLGMSKEDAQKHLQEIADFERSENRGQQVWRLKDNSRFVLLTIGYDSENKIRYVAGITNDKGSQKLRYADVGDLSKSQQNVSQGNYEYIWDVPESQNSSAYQVISLGNKPDFSMILTLKKTGAENSEEEEKEERERK